jgi:hypothetical protein
MLRPSSIPDEYYFGDLPGTLQYKVPIESIRGIIIPDGENTRNFNLCSHDNVVKLIPKTQLKKKWSPLLIMKRTQEDGVIYYKGAFLNKETNTVSLLTSTNDCELSRPLETNCPEYFVGHYRMSAPLCFWRELKIRIILSE